MDICHWIDDSEFDIDVLMSSVPEQFYIKEN